MSGQFLLLLCFIEISELNANSVDPDQMPHSGSKLFANILFVTLGINGLIYKVCISIALLIPDYLV